MNNIEPVAWVRYRSDGGFEGPIMDTDARMCDTRRSFWTPLYAAPLANEANKPAPSVEQDERAAWRDHPAALDAKALATAQEIALMWRRDRSQFVSRIQVAVRDAMDWVRAASTSANVAQGADRCAGCLQRCTNNPPDCYAAPPAQHKSDWHPDFVTALYDNADPDKRYTMDQMREYADAFHRSRIDAANVAQGAAAVATVKVYETYTGQNGWIEVTQEEYDRTKDKYEHRIRRVSAPPAQTATMDDARDAARYRWLRKEHFPTADNPPLAQVVWKAFDNRHSSDWANMIDGNDLDRAIDAALTAAQSASGDTK